MQVLTIIVAVIDILVCLGLIALVIMQEGNQKGLGVIGGGSTDTFYGKQGSRGKQARMKQLTKIFAITFAVLTVVLFLMTGRGA
ncbi:MAG TPA: preprotein translocase subunit SecG [Clostridiaceae bacterium]|nr:preprotein translocase subunit SecG [Clostridiaceae bacterium]